MQSVKPKSCEYHFLSHYFHQTRNQSLAYRSRARRFIHSVIERFELLCHATTTTVSPMIRMQIKTAFKGVGRWGLRGTEAPHIFSAPHRNFEPLFKFWAPFQKFITTVHPIALQQWLMASLVIRFFSSLIPSNQRRPTNFCNFVTKVNKIAKLVGFPGTFVHKAFRALLSL